MSELMEKKKWAQKVMGALPYLETEQTRSYANAIVGTVMLHEPMVSCEIGGKSSSLQAVSDALLRRKQEMNGLLAKHTGQSVEIRLP